jgi:hypothetical protein
MQGVLDALNVAFRAAPIPENYFAALYDDPDEAKAMATLHADRMRSVREARTKR